MQVIRSLALAIFLGACLCMAIPNAHAQVSISINIEPPLLPVYGQPPIPEPGYLWVPGYWAWNDEIDDYYWVPGTWILPPEPGLLWTPGYWAWNDGAYVFYDGYWGPEIGFYGGVNYGFGYAGFGYEGGYWRNGDFFYNSSVNNISNTSITNVYNKTVVVNNTSNVSYNGGAGGTTAKPTAQQLAIAEERHLPPTQEQTRHVQTAAKDPALSLTQSQGHPAVAATPRPARLKGPGVVAARPGTPVLPAKPGTLSGPSHALPGFSPQPSGKPAVTGPALGGRGPASAATGPVGPGPADKKLPSTTHASPGFSPAVTGPALGRPGRASAAIGPGVGLGPADKRLPSPPGAKPLTPPGTAKPVVPTTPHPTPPPVVHQATPSPPAVHQATLPPPVVHQATPSPVVHQPAPPPARMAQPQPARPVAPAPHMAAPPPAVHPAPPPNPSAAGKPKCVPGQPCR